MANNDLMCPITLSWLEDPVTVPCCGQSFSRQSILDHLTYTPNCPLCKAELDSIAIQSLPKSVNLAYMVEQAQKLNVPPPSFFENPQPKWKAQVHKLCFNTSTIGQLTIVNTDNSFNFQTLLLVVVDVSGSMGGTPMKHCQYSLNRVIDLSYKHSQLLTIVVAYDDRASHFVIDTKQPTEIHRHQVSQINRGGGTSFNSAFDEIIKLCSKYSQNNMVSSMVTVFLTDGEDSSVQKDKRGELVSKLKRNIENIWSKPYTIHTVGFGQNHDYEFLDKLRLIGTTEGAFRFATNAEDSDSLSGKINSILDVIAESSAVPLKIVSTDAPVITGENNKYWLNLTKHNQLNPVKINISVNNQDPISLIAEYTEDSNDPDITDDYHSYLIDNIGSELMSISKMEQGLDKQLHCEILQQRGRAILSKLSYASANHNRLESLISNLKVIQSGGNVNQQKLNDMRFEGKFATQSNQIASSPAVYNMPTFTPKKESLWHTIRKPAVHRCYANKDSAEIFRVIGQYKSDEACSWLYGNYNDDKDQNGSDALIVASSIGRVSLVETILKYSKRVNTNNLGYNAVDMAILFGYWITYSKLRDAGFYPTISMETLLRTCLSYGYRNTAKEIINDGFEVTKDLVESAPNTQIATFLSTYLKEEITLETAIKKGMFDKVKKDLDQITQISWEPYLSIFEKPTEDHLNIIELLLQNKKADPMKMISLVSEDEITWPLFIACEKGQLSLVRLLMSYIKLEDLNKQNKKGTTVLWIASCNRHIDIVSELLNANADPNIANFKGDSPLIPACQKGADSIVELLLMCGADLNLYNKNRDNPVLICCRTGQHRILDNLLKRFSPQDLKIMLETYAEIDGFVPLLAATELDKFECIKVCVSRGADLEHKTREDNAILSGATALHLACFYNRLESLKVLHNLKANLIAQTSTQGYTPLHIAIRQGHVNIVRYLLNTSDGKSCLNVPDAEGRLPAYYVNTPELLEEFFTNKLANILDKIMCSNPETEKKCSEILTKYGQSLGCYEYADITNITFEDNTSLLSQALLRGNLDLVNNLLMMGANINKPDDYGLTPDFWATYFGYKTTTNPEIAKMHDRVQSLSKSNMQNKLLLNLQYGKFESLESELKSIVKMSDGFTTQVKPDVLAKLKKESNRHQSLLGFMEKLKTNKLGIAESQNKQYMESLVWDAKIHLIKKVASGETKLEPIHLFALYLFSAHPVIFQNVNQAIMNWTSDNIWNPFICCLYQATEIIQPFIGEVYRGINIQFNPTEYAIGDQITWNTFSVCTSEWKNAGDILKQKKGIIFIINSKSGRDISEYTKNPQDKDILFLPGSQFKITNFYKLDAICLGQKNIRTSTFGFKQDEILRANGVIIELEEMANLIA